MAETKIADVIVPELFTPYVLNKTAERSALWQSGIVGELDEKVAFGTEGGTTVNIPFWNDLSGESEVLSDGKALGVNNITAGKDIAILHARGKAWGANDLSKALSGDDPLGAIADLVADYWSREFQGFTVNTLKGVFGAASMAGNTHDISAGTGAAAVIDGVSFVDASYKLGDAVDKLTAIAMHSATMAALAKQGLIETVRDADGVVLYKTFMDRRVIVDDGMPVEGDVFTSFLFGQGAIGFQDIGAPVGVETDRDSLAGTDILINRRHFVLHPRGIKWAGDTGIAPNNAGLATAGNWERVYDPKQIRIVAFKHKIK
ncbi:major capsid protein [Acinetobacter baumannii]|uniref:major capsid protein n=2 Tax=Acinetobacter baumannii TaxID=470 RepID=UPI00070736A1|nr:major capsid protein [Acinetobacter baumannii]KQE42528.1 methyltransferase [Acinetobacter baumannii]MBC6804168.1 methyltransferase [Acinetobacter baumannii]MBC6818190.1 methyltransferase [Acinetobacter baumannii]QJF32023.1 methyltransferase [Acinetobacter baumannii]QJF36210.1 methyltransferase [Acinetobacter baumannii]